MLRYVLQAVQHGLPTPALSASLAYYDSFRAATLHSAQCVQAQRDCFGSHG
jgi:6-phosphogluconate dehydrogenase